MESKKVATKETYQDFEKKKDSWDDVIYEFNKLNKPYTLDVFYSWLKENYSPPKQK